MSTSNSKEVSEKYSKKIRSLQSAISVNSKMISELEIELKVFKAYLYFLYENTEEAVSGCVSNPLNQVTAYRKKIKNIKMKLKTLRTSQKLLKSNKRVFNQIAVANARFNEYEL